MYSNKRHLLSYVIIMAIVVSLLGCFGPFYTTLATYYVTEDKKDYTTSFHNYKIKFRIGAVERDNRQGTNNFGFFLTAESFSKYKVRLLYDTLNAIRFDPVCVYYFSYDSTFCLEYFRDSSYAIWWDGKIHQQPRWDFKSLLIPMENDSIRIIFTASLYKDSSYSQLLDQKQFSKTLYRKYKKSIPITR